MSALHDRFPQDVPQGGRILEAGCGVVRVVRGCAESAQILAVWASGRLGHCDARRFWSAPEG